MLLHKDGIFQQIFYFGFVGLTGVFKSYFDSMVAEHIDYPDSPTRMERNSQRRMENQCWPATSAYVIICCRDRTQNQSPGKTVRCRISFRPEKNPRGNHRWKNLPEICMKHAREQPVTPSVRLGKPVDAELEKLVMRCLFVENVVCIPLAGLRP